VFASVIRYRFNRDSNGMRSEKKGLLMGDFAVLNDDYSLTNIKNTSIFFESRNNYDKSNFTCNIYYVSFKQSLQFDGICAKNLAKIPPNCKYWF
jgi:hypothetical protein